ncbi:MAG TPA: PilW family protein [Solimonas sp.]|nr:PilW family protein [Solimonas sp.]
MRQSLHGQRGLSLVELLISMALGLVLILGIVTLFLQSQRSQRQNSEIQGMQDQARFAMQQLSRDLAMAGYWGGLYSGSDIAVSAAALAALPPGSDCGPDTAATWAFKTAQRVEFRNQDAGTAASASYRCVGQVQASTDMIAVRRVAGQESAAGSTCNAISLSPNTFYLKTNGTVGTLIRLGSGASYLPCMADEPVAAPVTFYKYVPRLYYVRSWTQKAGDGLPSLCRRELRHEAAAQLAEECLADGVEDFQVSWGLDTDGDGQVDRYSNSPAATDMGRVRTAQIFLLLRSVHSDRGYEDQKTYTLADHVYEPAAVPGAEGHDPSHPVHYLRRLFTTTVQMRNASF